MIDQVLKQTQEKMHKSVDVTVGDLATIRSGRASTAIVENISISAYDGTQKLKLMEMATLSTPDTKTILVTPYDISQIPAISKGILESNTGLTPSAEGDVVRISIPQLSQERRQEYIKLARTKVEAGKVMIRQVRHEAIKDLKQALDDNQISEDEEKIGEKKIQELTDHHVAELDQIMDRKESELSQI